MRFDKTICSFCKTKPKIILEQEQRIYYEDYSAKICICCNCPGIEINWSIRNQPIITSAMKIKLYKKMIKFMKENNLYNDWSKVIEFIKQRSNCDQ